MVSLLQTYPFSAPSGAVPESASNGQTSDSALANASASGAVVSEDWNALRAYLGIHSDLGLLLPALCTAARDHFGPDAQLELELYRDPETRDECVTLYVRLPRYPEDIMSRIESLAMTFYDRLDQVSGDFLLTTDFRRVGGANAL